MPKILFTKLAILIISTILAVFPFLAIASVYINEVAWMGTDNSANDEWVEIYNDGSESVDLSGWMLFAGDGTPSINFSGTTNTAIPAGGFYLLERTDDTTVSSITADLIYVGALSNDGEVLILKDKNGNEADRIDASSGWLAGDNVSKQTMQKTSSVWITANGTPKAVNVGQSGSQNQSSISQASSSAQASSNSSTSGIVSGSVSYVFNSEQISAKAGQDKTAIAGADIILEGQSFGTKGDPILNARYLWTLGDGSYKEGQNIRHIYKYPGNYIAVLNASSGDVSASDRLNIKVVPNELEIIDAKNEFIKLKNKSNLILDLSGWFLRVGGIVFKFPDYSLISANAELIISSDVSGLKFTNDNFSAEILYPNGSLAFSYEKQKQTVLPKIVELSSGFSAESIKPKKETLPKQPEEKDNVFISRDTLQNKISTTSNNLTAENNLAGVIVAGNKSESNFIWWFVLAIFAGTIGGGGLFLARNKN